MDSVKDMLLLLISSSIVSNIVLSQFMGLCPFLGVSRKIKTAGGMGTAVIFVITLASAVAGVIYKFILQPLHIEYLETIVFILVIAALVQFVENVPEKGYAFSVSGTGCISAPDHHQLCGFRCSDYQCTEGIRYSDRYCKRICHSPWFYHCHRDPGWIA